MAGTCIRRRGAISGRTKDCSWQLERPTYATYPATLWPSPGNVLRQLVLTIFSSEYSQVLIKFTIHLPPPEWWKAELAWAPRVWITCLRLFHYSTAVLVGIEPATTVTETLTLSSQVRFPQGPQCSIIFAKLYLCGSRTNWNRNIHKMHKICCHTTW